MNEQKVRQYARRTIDGKLFWTLVAILKGIQIKNKATGVTWETTVDEALEELVTNSEVLK